ncbi:hypothetical protein PtA15_2A268 [Puccinia triticina]|uniref:Uncharacterized protein n=1 Tax=Puccinia triticina TaxID=208348 RepID=A0ABY7C9W3_9BASI|nr:uncharacterized protein PtA15_2A268 [Puccinia triticina]WAQ81955.1 hypothetical protein PtA15_2A268 [Puccinia triticina]
MPILESAGVRRRSISVRPQDGLLDLRTRDLTQINPVVSPTAPAVDGFVLLRRGSHRSHGQIQAEI